MSNKTIGVSIATKASKKRTLQNFQTVLAFSKGRLYLTEFARRNKAVEARTSKNSRPLPTNSLPISRLAENAHPSHS